MEKNSYNNYNSNEFKNAKWDDSDYKKGSGASDFTGTAKAADASQFTGTARPVSTTQSTGTSSYSRTRQTARRRVTTSSASSADARKKLESMTIWEAMEESEVVSDSERWEFTVAGKEILEGMSEDGEFADRSKDLFEILLLVGDGEVSLKLLTAVVAKNAVSGQESKRPFLEAVGGTLGKACCKVKEKSLSVLDDLGNERISAQSALDKITELEAEAEKCIRYAECIREKANQIGAAAPRFDPNDAHAPNELVVGASMIAKYYELIGKEMKRIREAQKNASDQLKKEPGVKAKPAPEDPVLKELRRMTPKAVHDKMIQDEDYRRKSAGILAHVRSMQPADDIDMFERFLFLGVQEKSLDVAMQKVQKTVARNSPTGWLGSRISALRTKKGKAPTVPSGWGMLGGLIIIALFAALAAFLYMTPAVASFIAGAASVILAIGMIVSFLLGLAGGLIGGILAALAWALVTYLLNQLITIDKLLHILVCLLALAPSLFGLGMILSSTPGARKKAAIKRENHFDECQVECDELLEYVHDVMTCISSASDGAEKEKFLRYYQNAERDIKRLESGNF